MIDNRRWTPTKEEAARQARPPAISMIFVGNAVLGFMSVEGRPQAFAGPFPYNAAASGQSPMGGRR